MSQIPVTVNFLEADRARGTIAGDDFPEMKWTAVANNNNGWYIVLDGALPTGDAALLRLIQDNIRRTIIKVRRAA